MKNTLNKITFILSDLDFNYVTLKSHKDFVILFNKNIDLENVIFGISIDMDLEHIDMGNLCQLGKNVILGCSHRLSITPDLKIIVSQNIQHIKASIEKSDKIDYLDNEMKLKQKFLNVNAIIETFARKNNYTLLI